MELECKVMNNPKAKRDYALIREAVCNNNQKAYAELMSNYRDSLYMLMFKMVNNQYEAEDLTIEAFSKAFKHLNQYTGESAFSTWLFKIASNNCVDFMRKKRLDTLLFNYEYDEYGYSIPIDINDDTPNPEEKMFSKEKSTVIRSLVEELKPHYRELILLRYYEELSYEEIAAKLNIPLGSVKAKLFRAKEMLHAIMSKEVF